MKRFISLGLTALFATVAVAIAGPDADAIMAKEKAAWQAFKDKKGDDFKKLVHADMRAVYPEGISNMQTEMSDMQKWDMKSFALSDFNATAIGDTLVTTYKVVIEGSYEGKDTSGTYNAGSVWTKVKGEWQAVFHTNVKVVAAAK
jgi:hypothetical protein